MNGKAAKAGRKIARETAAAITPGIQAALQNETVTRARVEQLEKWAEKFTNATLLGRLRWVFLGR